MTTSPEPTTPTITVRRRPLALAVGITTLALAGAALISLPDSAVAQDEVDAPRMQAHTVHQMRGAEGMQHRNRIDPAERAARMAEMAEQFGVDPVALSATMEALRADMGVERDVMRDALMQLEPEARREAMREFSEERRTAMIAALEALGVDPDVFAQHQAERQAERGSEHGPRQHRGGQGMRR
jgi:hypothetical protein